MSRHIVKKLERTCPKCQFIISYKTLWGFRLALQNNSHCKSCASNINRNPNPITVEKKNRIYERFCPACYKKLVHIKRNISKRNFLLYIKRVKTRLCLSCAKLKNYQENPEIQKKQRKARIEDMMKKFGHIPVPNYNPIACKLIEKYGKNHGYNFQHAENGGEYYIKDLGYWVDGYDKDKNIVIEIYEKHHNLKKNIKRDDRRKQEIINFLDCKFIEIKL